MTIGHDVGLVIKQRIQDMQSFAGGCWDRLDVERRIAAGDVGVELGSGIVAVMSVEVGGGAATAAGPEKLAVRRRSPSIAEHRRERLALLLVDQPLKRQGVGLVTDMPFGRPGKLAEAGDAARFGHARQTEIEPVGKEARHQDLRIAGCLAGSQMGEAVRKERPARCLGQKVGDPDARQHGVKARGEGLGLRRRRFGDGRDLQRALVDRNVGQQSVFCLRVDQSQPFIQEGAAPGDKTLEISLDRDRQVAVLLQFPQGLSRDQPRLESAKASAAHNPHVAGAQPVTQFR